jgi:hypothetical protein
VERALAVWLQRRRQDAGRGALSPMYAEGLKAIPGWDQQPSRKTRDEARWQRRLAELIDYMAAGNDWPRHKKTDSKQERTLGIWLHTQRMNTAAANWTRTRKRSSIPICPDGGPAGCAGASPAHKSRQPAPLAPNQAALVRKGVLVGHRRTAAVGSGTICAHFGGTGTLFGSRQCR